MVEQSQIDWYAHSNDPVGVISEVLAFDEAWKAAIDFAVKDGNTVVLSTSDHATGGMTMTNYDSMDDLRELLKNAKKTSYELEYEVRNGDVQKLLEDNYALPNLSKEQIAQIKESLDGEESDDFSKAIGHILGERIGVYFGTDDHNTHDVALFAYHPKNFKPTDFKQSGVIQNTDVNHYIQHIIGLDLGKIQQTMYISSDAFIAKGATVNIDRSDEMNPVITITKGNAIVKLPVDKNIALVDGKTVELGAVTLIIKEKVWVSRDTIDLIK